MRSRASDLLLHSTACIPGLLLYVTLKQIILSSITKYFCEDGGASSGVFGRNKSGKYFTIMVGRTDLQDDETTGLAFGRGAKNMYVTYQEGGMVYDCTRDDGRPLDGNTLDIKYHAT